MPDPTIEAAREIFDEAVDHLREAIDGLSPEALAWQPAGEDSNPITVLAVHGMHSSDGGSRSRGASRCRSATARPSSWRSPRATRS